MIRIDVTEATATPKTIDYKGKPITFHEQVAWAHLIGQGGTADPHPTKIVISHEKPDNVYPKGSYTLAPESLYAGRFGKLEIGRLRLKPIAAAASRSA